MADTRRACVCCWLLLVATQLRLADGAPHPSNMHTVFLAECSDYFQWQSVGMFYSHKTSGQPGPVTRVMCCQEGFDIPQVHLQCQVAHADGSGFADYM